MKHLESLIYASSEHSADAFYFSKILIPDAFVAFSFKGKRLGVLSMLEIARARKQSAFDEVLSWETVSAQVKQAGGTGGLAEGVAFLQKQYGIEGFRVPAEFPASLYVALTRLGVTLEVETGAFFKNRLIKTPQELEFLIEANRAAGAGISAVKKWIDEASVAPDGRLMHAGAPLTSERLQALIAKKCLDYGATAPNSIVAGGDQACDPHERGHGPLYAQTFIIIDVFPRMQRTGYYGDMTRTVFKGVPNEAQRRLYNSVLRAQQEAIAKIKAGAVPQVLQAFVEEAFEADGYLTTSNDVPQGFIHSLGHGLGLDLHELPSLSRRTTEPLEAGNVVTVEPGLYYPGLGGVRIEDVVCVTADGVQLLSGQEAPEAVPL